jgi:sRNA-binding protein
MAENEDLPPGAKLMVEEGLPRAAIMTETERKHAWKGVKLTKPRDLKVPAKDEDPATKQLRKELAAEGARKTAERFARLKELKTEASKAATTQESSMRKSATKKTAAKPAKSVPKTARRTRPARVDSARGVRPGSKLEVVVGLLKRKEGCTAAEVLAATDWPAVSMPQMAKAGGLKLRKEKAKGEPSRYFGE